MTSSEQSPDPTTDAPTDATDEREGVEVDADVTSDPALDDSGSSEWAGEGGATDEGPATEVADS